MNTKYTIIIFLLLLFFVNVVVADLPTKTVFNPYGGHLQLIPNTTGIFSNTSALILALQGNDSVINNSIIALQGNDSVINNSIIALQNNDTVINASILQLQNNDTSDRSYVNNTFFKSSGGNLSGAFLPIRNSHNMGAFSVLDLDVYSLSSFFLSVNTKLNETSIQLENTTHTDRFASILNLRGNTVDGRFEYNICLPNTTGLNCQINVFNAIYTSSTNSNFKIIPQNMTIQVQNLSGSGNAYACIDSTGKVYRSAIACA